MSNNDRAEVREEDLKEDIRVFRLLLDEHRYDFCKLIFLIFPFGQKGHELENAMPYDWQMKEWARLSKHLQNPLTRFKPYKLNISSGNGSAKTAFMCMTFLMLMYTQRVRARITANTQPQLRSVTWPELDVWYRRARYATDFFEKLGEKFQSRDQDLAETWRADAVTWDETNPVAVSGLHNKGYCVFLGFDEAAGIPHIIWKYADGAMSDVDTIKVWIAVGNSDDPNSQFEQNMNSPDWNSLRIDTRTLKHVDQDWVASLLRQCNNDEDHDDFRVRVRGLPRKSAQGTIIKWEVVERAFGQEPKEDALRSRLPSLLTCDPAWQGGDETVICHKQGNVITILERFRLVKGMDHSFTYNIMCQWERKLKVDQVFIDQAEGTSLYTLAQQHNKHHWRLIAFGSLPNDMADPKESEYANMRALMYYKAEKFLSMEGGIIRTARSEWREETMKQLTWAKEDRHKVTGKKKVGSKIDLKNEYGKSPDVADAIVLCFADIVTQRLPEHDSPEDSNNTGPMVRDDEYNPYELLDNAYTRS